MTAQSPRGRAPEATRTPERSGHRRALSRARTVVAALFLAVLSGRAQSPEPRSDAEATAEGFQRAIDARELEFPRDHGSHPGFKTEWWYLTGSLRGPTGEEIGYQATWFRSALTARPAERRSPLAARELMFFHGALTDVESGVHRHEDVASRAVPGWARADSDRLHVAVFQHSLVANDDGTWSTEFTVEGRRVRLRLWSTRPPLLHGVVPGLSQKGPRPGQASYYYSLTRLRTEGTIEREPGGETISVRGESWFDQEFGSNQLAEGQSGWDWFSARLDDGTDLMLYALRRVDGTIEPASSGTIRSPDGERAHLGRDDFTIESLDTWTSPRSGGTYPSRWRLRVPSRAIEIEVRPLVDDQEMTTPGSTAITYWEGLCEYRGLVEGRPVVGRGYVELVGYAGRFLADI